MVQSSVVQSSTNRAIHLTYNMVHGLPRQPDASDNWSHGLILLYTIHLEGLYMQVNVLSLGFWNSRQLDTSDDDWSHDLIPLYTTHYSIN